MMTRTLALSLALAGCAHAASSSPEPASSARCASPSLDATSFPRRAACVLRTEPGISGDAAGPGVECVPPRQETPIHAAQRLRMEGDVAGAADCVVAAYELAPDQPRLAFEAAQLYRVAGVNELARAYYRRFLAEAPSAEGADEARRQLDALDALAGCGATRGS